jgi:hypothetical protein
MRFLKLGLSETCNFRIFNDTKRDLVIKFVHSVRGTTLLSEREVWWTES